jgi:hypothetical protein
MYNDPRNQKVGNKRVPGHVFKASFRWMRSSGKDIYRVKSRDPPVKTHTGISFGSYFEDSGMDPGFFSVYVFSMGEMLLHLSISHLTEMAKCGPKMS